MRLYAYNTSQMGMPCEIMHGSQRVKTRYELSSSFNIWEVPIFQLCICHKLAETVILR